MVHKNIVHLLYYTYMKASDLYIQLVMNSENIQIYKPFSEWSHLYTLSQMPKK